MAAFVLKEELEQLRRCVESNLLTESEFIAQKEKILALHLQTVRDHFQSSPPIAISTPNSEHTFLRSGNSSPLATPQTPLFAKTEIKGTPLNNQVSTGNSEISTRKALTEFIETTPTQNSSYDCNVSLELEPGAACSPSIHTEKKSDCSVTSAPVLDVSQELNESFADSQTLVTLDHLTSEQFWSIVLMINVGEGEFYPHPSLIFEKERDPFFVPKSIFDHLITKDKNNGLQNGASVMLKAYHATVFKNLHIPWCIERVYLSTATNDIYYKPDLLRIDWYCPWSSCEVRKRWHVIIPQLIDQKKRKVNHILPQNQQKHKLIEKIPEMEIPEETYAVVELLGGRLQHTHRKGEKGGIRVHIDAALKECEEIKDHLKDMSKHLKKGTLIQLFSKQVAPIVTMAQALINQPPEAFLGGFTDIVPHTLACYQKDNQIIREKLLSDFNIQKNESLASKLTKMLNKWVDVDCVKRKELSTQIPFDNKKCVVGYIQQLSFYKDDKWACICFNEAQLLSLMVNLQVEPALMWDGTDPNTKVKDNVLMFPLLSRVGYTIPNKKKVKELGMSKKNPAQVVARVFTNIKDVNPHRLLFDLLLQKSKMYSSTGGLSLKGIVLLTDMDPIIDALCIEFGMQNWWDKRHVNQAVLHKLQDRACLGIVMTKLSEIRDCVEKSVADALLAELKTLLTTAERNGVSNSFYDMDAWNYLNKVIFKDLDKLCKWTIAHLGDDFWEYTQASESRNNKDLNIWNGGATQLSIEECLLRYYEIDKAELRSAYLRFLEADLELVKRTLQTKRKEVKKKFISTLVRDFLEVDDKTEVEDAEESAATENIENRAKDEDSKEEVVANTDQEDTIVNKQKELKRVLRDIKIESSNHEAPETQFNKPSKRRKQPRTAVAVSEQQENLANFMITGNAEAIPTVTNADGSKSVAFYYLWSKSNLHRKSLEELRTLCATNSLKISGTKSVLIKRLLDLKETLMTEYFKETIEKSSAVTTAAIEVSYKNDLDVAKWSEQKLKKLTVVELTDMCKTNEIPLGTNKRKLDIVDSMMNFKRAKSEHPITYDLTKTESLVLQSPEATSNNLESSEILALPFDAEELKQAKNLALQEEKSQLPLTEEELTAATMEAINLEATGDLMHEMMEPSYYLCLQLAEHVSTLKSDSRGYFDDVVMNSYAELLQRKFSGQKFVSSFMFSGIHCKQAFAEVAKNNKSIFSFYNSGDVHWNTVHIEDTNVVIYESLSRPLTGVKTAFQKSLKELYKSTVIPKWIVLSHQTKDSHTCGPMSLAYVALILLGKEVDQPNLQSTEVKEAIRTAILNDLALYCQTGGCDFSLFQVLEDQVLSNSLYRRSSRGAKKRTPFSPK